MAMDDMKGKTVLITGADGGIGREITRALAKQGAALVMACIDADDARPVREEIVRESGNSAIEIMQIDLPHSLRSGNSPGASPTGICSCTC